MNVTIVPASNDPAKALAAAHLVWDSSDHFLEHLYAGKQRRAFEDLQYHWLQAAGLLSHRHALLATDGAKNEILGLALAFGGDQENGQRNLTGQHMAALATEQEIPDFYDRMEALSQFHPEIPSNALYLQNIAVRGTMRGRRIGELLFQAIVGRARSEGFTALHLDVVSDNPAISFYRRQGMEILSESDVPDLRTNHGQPPRYRMVMDIPKIP